MVDVCVGYLQTKVTDAMGPDFMGGLPQVFETLKELAKCMDVRCAAVLIRSDTLSYSGLPSRNLETGQDDLKLFDRSVVIDLVMGDTTKALLNRSFERLLLSLNRGLHHYGHYIGIELGEAEWVDRKDSILNAEIALELPITFTGGVYKPKTYKQITSVLLERQES